MSADFNFYLNTQGLRGRTGDKGDQGFSPIITVGQNTLNTFTLNITTVDGTFETPNLRGSVVSGTGEGTILAYDRATDTIYLTSIPEANTENLGLTRLATEAEVASATGTGVVTAENLPDFISANLFDYLSAGNGIGLSVNSTTGVVSIGILTGFVASKITATNSNGIKLTKDNSTGVTDIDINTTGLKNNFTDSPVGTNRVMLNNGKIYIQDNEQQIVFRGLNNGGTDGDIIPRKTDYYVGLDIKKSFVPNSLSAGSNISLTKDFTAGTVEINATVPTKTSDLTNDSGFITSSDLPTVGNGTITFTQGGVTKGTITTNQSEDTTIALDAGGSGGGDVVDVQVGGTSVLDTTTGIANITNLSDSNGNNLVSPSTGAFDNYVRFGNLTNRSMILTNGIPEVVFSMSSGSYTDVMVTALKMNTFLIGDGVTITTDGATYQTTISTNVATANSTGVVKPDGTTITVDANGTISSVGGGSSIEVYYE